MGLWVGALCAVDVALRGADRRNAITVTVRPSRLGGTYIVLGDETGLICVANDADDANRILQRAGCDLRIVIDEACQHAPDDSPFRQPFFTTKANGETA